MYVIGTAGHVDHGKSTLVTKLTGIDPDRLREEKERGLTIDLGFAWLTLPSGREVSIVDVPGHQRFVKNMLAGAGGLDLAILVVAADEGVREQTREHFAILDVLEVPSLIVALTKSDAVDAEFLELVTLEVRDFIDASRFAGAPVLAVSAVTGAGLDTLLAALDTTLDATPERTDQRRPRLSVDRVFPMRGFGTVVTGTLVGGALEVGQDVEFQPGGLTGRIRGLQRHGRAVERLLPGTRAAVNVSGVNADEVERGMILARPGMVRPASTVGVRLVAVPTLDAPVKRGAGITFLAGSAETEARLRLLDRAELLPGDEAWGIVQLEAPIALVEGDRFVIRTANETAAGGIVVMTDPPVRQLRRAALVDAMAARLESSPGARLLTRLLDGPLSRDGLATAAGVSGPVLDEAVAALHTDGSVQEIRGALYATTWLDAQGDQAVATVRNLLAERPLRSNVPQEHVRSQLHLDAAAFRAVLARTSDGGRTVVDADGTLTLPGHTVRLTEAQQREVDAFLATLRETRFGTVAGFHNLELAAYVASDLTEDLGSGTVADREAFQAMKAATEAHIREHGAITLAEARDLLETSRKYAQAYLERLDALDITRRVGDTRVLRGA